ncbi:cyanoexosortase B system-associated protein [Cyanothece sp. BG0011]|uniref:cyanoexosortase B system-associated protein n=1 Tax=Cyanothece sp. BG0011 TaxID=2082950 RepID=UPI0018E53D20|nr:cyanoexosortase B system-associated protein [Cyanothece sp. BG0011]
MFKLKKGLFISQLVILCLLGLAIIFVAVPSYFSQQWSWSDLPRVPEVAQMRQIPETPLNLTGWTTIGQEKLSINNYPWSFQIIEKPGQKPVVIALKGQKYYKDHPEVEWVDLQGIEKWKTDSYQTLKFPSTINPNHSITARWFQAWNNKTYAVVQWYAWPGGGHYAPYQWFLADQKAQLKDKRVPWVTVSIKIPMEALGNLEDMESLGKLLGQEVQKTLEKEVFIDKSAS